MGTTSEELKLRERFSSNLKRIMDERQINASALDEKAGVTISRFLNQSRTPNLYTALRIANALNVSLDELCGNYTYFSYDRKRGLSAGDSLEILFTLADLFKTTLKVNSLEIPDSNVRDALIDYHLYFVKYKFAKELSPAKFKQTPKEAQTDFMTRTIAKLRNTKIKLHNSKKKTDDTPYALIDYSVDNSPTGYQDSYDISWLDNDASE